MIKETKLQSTCFDVLGTAVFLGLETTAGRGAFGSADVDKGFFARSGFEGA